MGIDSQNRFHSAGIKGFIQRGVPLAKDLTGGEHGSFGAEFPLVQGAHGFFHFLLMAGFVFQVFYAFGHSLFGKI